MRAMLGLLVIGGLASPLHAQEQTDTTFAVEPGGTLSIDNHQGAVRIRSWDRAAMRVGAAHSSRIRIEIDRSATGVQLEGDEERGPAHGIEYDITVPRNYSIEVDCNECGVLVQDVDGDVVVDNGQGDIIVRGGRGRREIDSTNGEIIVTGARGAVIADSNNGNVRMSDITGDVSVDANNGNVHMSDITGDVSAESVTGEIQLANIAADNVHAETTNGPIHYQGSLRNGGRYDLSSHNGSLRVTIPADVGADVHVSTHNGEIESDFPVEVRGALQQGEMSFVIGTGGAQLDLESFNGTIQLVRPQ